MITLRSYQEEAVSRIFQYYADGGTGNILEALPTGTGKSIIIGEFINRAIRFFPSTRVIALTHVRELIEQNEKALLDCWPTAPVGIFSAGLKRKDTVQPIIYGGVQSVANCPEIFSHRDLMFIDEAHLLSPNANTRYQKIISKLREINPRMKVIGFSATIFRLGQGLLTNGDIFDECVYNLCDVDGFHRLIIEGWLSPPIVQVTKTTIDVSNVGINSGGDYNESELQKAAMSVSESALAELCAHGQDRQCWLLFCSGIDHAEQCADILNAWGIPTAAVHSKIGDQERNRILQEFRQGKLRAVTNNNILTTGFDHKPIDLIGCLRPTISASLWVQMVGRGTRPSEETGKRNCLVKDFAGNTKRLGPIDDPLIPRPKGQGTGDVPVKICPSCGTYNHTRVQFCMCCGFEFTFQTKITRQSASDDILTGGMPVIEVYQIDQVVYQRHVGKKSGIANIRVFYHCGLQTFSEFISFDQHGFALHRAHDWWRARHVGEPPLSTDMALARLNECRAPRQVRVWVNRPFPQVMGVVW